MKGKILVFAALAALVSCGDKKSEQEKDDEPLCKIGEYIYLSGDVHIDRNCPYAFSHAHFVEPRDLTRDMIKEECDNEYCRMCIDDDSYSMLQSILNANEKRAAEEAEADSSEEATDYEYE